MHVSAKDLLLALTIGAEVFAIAALWPLSEWAVKAQRAWALGVAMAVVLACVALDTHTLMLGVAEPGSLRATLSHALQGAVLPLFIAFPDAVCIASAQSLARVGMSPRYARATALAVAAVAVVVAPLPTIVAGCGLAGTCW